VKIDLKETFTIDWQAARRSVEFLADLEPKVVGAGHGKPIKDADTAQQLKKFRETLPLRRKVVVSKLRRLPTSAAWSPFRRRLII
jgi:hypothetical protein